MEKCGWEKRTPMQWHMRRRHLNTAKLPHRPLLQVAATMADVANAEQNSTVSECFVEHVRPFLEQVGLGLSCVYSCVFAEMSWCSALWINHTRLGWGFEAAAARGEDE